MSGAKQCEFTHHMTRPVITAAQVTQQVSGLLTSSSSSLRQQHRQVRYIDNTSRLNPRPTAETQARKIRDCRTESSKHGADGQTKQEVEKPLMLIHLTSVMQCKTKLIKLQHFLNQHYCLLVSKRKKKSEKNA